MDRVISRNIRIVDGWLKGFPEAPSDYCDDEIYGTCDIIQYAASIINGWRNIYDEKLIINGLLSKNLFVNVPKHDWYEVMERASSLIGKIHTYYGFMFTENSQQPYKKVVAKTIRKYFDKKTTHFIKNNIIFITNADHIHRYNGVAFLSRGISFVYISPYSLDRYMEGNNYIHYLLDYKSVLIHEIIHALVYTGMIDISRHEKLYNLLMYLYKNKDTSLDEYMGRKHIAFKSEYYKKKFMDFLARKSGRSLFPPGNIGFDEFVANYEAYSKTGRYPKLLKYFSFGDEAKQ